MIARRFSLEDYPTVQHWWHLKTGGGDFPPLDALPTDGFIIDDVCAIWIYIAKNAPLAYVGWGVAMPDAPPRKVRSGFEMLYDECSKLARREGMRAIMTPHQKPSMHRLLVDCGFMKGEDTTLFVKGI